MIIHGGCHCGNLRFSLTWEPDPAKIPARACTCPFCTKHGGVWTSSPRGKLDVAIEDRERISEYEFGTRTAKFHICSRCGIVPVVTCVREDTATLARRKRNWIPDVTFR